MNLYLSDTLPYIFSSCSTFDIVVYSTMLLATFAAAWKAPGWIRTIGKISLMMCFFCFLVNIMNFMMDLELKSPTLMIIGSHSSEFDDLLRTSPEIRNMIARDFKPLMMGDIARIFSSICLGGFTYLVNSITCIIRLPRL